MADVIQQLLGRFRKDTAGHSDHSACRSKNRLNQRQGGKLTTRSLVQSLPPLSRYHWTLGCLCEICLLGEEKRLSARLNKWLICLQGMMIYSHPSLSLVSNGNACSSCLAWKRLTSKRYKVNALFWP